MAMHNNIFMVSNQTLQMSLQHNHYAHNFKFLHILNLQYISLHKAPLPLHENCKAAEHIT
jgi:hypothetical protein